MYPTIGNHNPDFVNELYEKIANMSLELMKDSA